MLVWILLVLIVFGGGGGTAAWFFHFKPPNTFVKGNVGAMLMSQVSEYQQKEVVENKLIAPAPRTLPTGEFKDLFAKLVELSLKPETLMPAASFGMVDYQAVLEKQLAKNAEENKDKPRRKKVNLFRTINRRKARKLSKQYDAILVTGLNFLKDRIAAGVTPKATGGQRSKAKRACLLVLENYRPGADTPGLKISCKKLEKYFEKAPVDPPAKSGKPGGMAPAKPGMDAAKPTMAAAKPGMDAMKPAMGSK